MCDIIRNVRTGDEAHLAHIQTESWKAAFQDILSQELLKKLTEPERAAAMYRQLLDDHIGNGYLLEADGVPHCIAWWDRARDEDMAGYAELICIHSLPNNWRKGHGTQMMERVLRDMKQSGYEKVMLWVFADNVRARKFYEACGFTFCGKTKPFLDTQEVCYEKTL